MRSDLFAHDLSQSHPLFAQRSNRNRDPQSYMRTATNPTSRIKVTVLKQWISSP